MQTAPGEAREVYTRLQERFGRLKPAELRTVSERMEAILREMGLDFGMHIENFPSREELDRRLAREKESA